MENPPKCTKTFLEIVSEYRNCSIQSQFTKVTVFLYIRNEQLEFYIFLKNLIIAIKKEVLKDISNKIVDVCAENYKTMMKEIKKNI